MRTAWSLAARSCSPEEDVSLGTWGLGEATPRVPGYRLQHAIGTGRQGSVWLAQDLRSGAATAVKMRAGDASFEHEASVAARASGPHVVQVLGHGHAAGLQWMAMEYLPGGSLARHITGRLQSQAALAWVRQAARALAPLHRQQLVHRDVKPANFLLRADGTLVIADLGLVAEAGTVCASFDEGVLVGTPRYVAPEQLQGAPARPAADVYALGVLLYEMLAGRPPFAGPSALEVLAQHLVAPAPRLPQDCDSLQPLVDRMLARELNCRLPDADAVLALLGQKVLK
jgi:serine/threonine-protein kinase PpkA